MRFVIIGTGRCGTTWISHILTAAGIRCGHENIWRPDQYNDRWLFLDEHGERIEYFGCASVYALPYLERSGFDGVILHQIREPAACIGSLVGWRLPSWPNKQGAGGQFINDNLRFELTGDRIADASNYWCEWNERCMRVANFTYHVEDINPETLVTFAGLVGRELTETVAAAAIAEYADWDYSAAPARPDMKAIPVNIADLPVAVRAMGELHGYKDDATRPQTSRQ